MNKTNLTIFICILVLYGFLGGFILAELIYNRNYDDHSNCVPCVENPRFLYIGDGWMVDLQEEQSVTMAEALKRSKSVSGWS
jgi:hypothetical protein